MLNRQLLLEILLWQFDVSTLVELVATYVGGGDRGLKIAAATYLKNFTRRWLHGDNLSVDISKEFKDQLMIALLKVEPEILKVLVEVVCTTLLHSM